MVQPGKLAQRGFVRPDANEHRSLRVQPAAQSADLTAEVRALGAEPGVEGFGVERDRRCCQDLVPVHARRASLARPLLGQQSGPGGRTRNAVEGQHGGLQTAGIPAEVAWARLGSEREMLVRIGNPVKRLLRPKVRIADPVAAGGSVVEWGINSPQLRARRGLVAAVWIAIVALVHTAPTAVPAESAAEVAEMILRRLTPRPDLAILLEIDPSTAAARKPHDQPRQILAEMEHLYERKARTGKLVHVDARKTPEEVEVRLSELVDALVEERVRRETPGLT